MKATRQRWPIPASATSKQPPRQRRPLCLAVARQQQWRRSSRRRRCRRVKANCREGERLPIKKKCSPSPTILVTTTVSIDTSFNTSLNTSFNTASKVVCVSFARCCMLSDQQQYLLGQAVKHKREEILSSFPWSEVVRPWDHAFLLITKTLEQWTV